MTSTLAASNTKAYKTTHHSKGYNRRKSIGSALNQRPRNIIVNSANCRSASLTWNDIEEASPMLRVLADTFSVHLDQSTHSNSACNSINGLASSLVLDNNCEANGQKTKSVTSLAMIDQNSNEFPELGSTLGIKKKRDTAKPKYFMKSKSKISSEESKSAHLNTVDSKISIEEKSKLTELDLYVDTNCTYLDRKASLYEDKEDSLTIPTNGQEDKESTPDFSLCKKQLFCIKNTPETERHSPNSSPWTRNTEDQSAKMLGVPDTVHIKTSDFLDLISPEKNNSFEESDNDMEIVVDVEASEPIEEEKPIECEMVSASAAVEDFYNDMIEPQDSISVQPIEEEPQEIGKNDLGTKEKAIISINSKNIYKEEEEQEQNEAIYDHTEQSSEDDKIEENLVCSHEQELHSSEDIHVSCEFEKEDNIDLSLTSKEQILENISQEQLIIINEEPNILLSNENKPMSIKIPILTSRYFYINRFFSSPLLEYLKYQYISKDQDRKQWILC